ncbi:hypothetical protein FACS1894154_09660 [Betaproteobacteria bacterium]|nr:hypothetical protein FACS1894154_09660 [Betaproteobacteria bacterium]GHU24199.1 hypothetical protein FACS189488_08340 [Betaproteobacteria bacterium]
MKLLSTALVAAGLLAVAVPSQAATFHFTGALTYHNEVAIISFSLDTDITGVNVYTDSFQGGTNFDPIMALWGGNGTLIAQNNDNAYINPSVQTWLDSGFSLPTLAAGDYFFSVAVAPNEAVGTNLSTGFIFDNQAPIMLNDYDMGNLWSVWLEGVPSATTPPGAAIPEPSLLALLGLGLMGLGASRLRKQA